jgi:hypothetical protein
MTKISERVLTDDGKLIIHQQHNYQAVADKAGHLRSAGLVGNKESKLVGVIPVKMWTEWAKKWGVKPNDHEAMKSMSSQGSLQTLTTRRSASGKASSDGHAGGNHEMDRGPRRGFCLFDLDTPAGPSSGYCRA